ncbi:MAG: carboxypeptidase-like regulatory domain-containing protein [Pirellulaceae bacterium]
MRILLAMATVAGLVTLSGCAAEGVPSDMASVSGQVTYNDSPVADATVIFMGSSNNKSAAGKTDEEGKFSLAMGTTPGVEPGEYVVTVTKTESPKQEYLPQDHPDYASQRPPRQNQTKQLLPAKYASGKATPLKATLAEGENDVPLELED